ncbi:MAG: methyltransferase domain-containing protein [Myxococcota bacterium]
MNERYQNDIHNWIQDYYGNVLKNSSDLKTNACCAVAPPKWVTGLLANVPEEVLSRFYGCGFPIPEALEGATVVDLGCGTGRDVYLLSQVTGETGRVIGLDMTEDQLAVARAHREWQRERLGYAESNVEFVTGYIEDLSGLGLEPGSADVVVSNCVVNLSPRKDLVLEQVHRILKEGGEFYLSDVVVDRRLPQELARDPLLYSECLGGAWYRHDFEDLAKRSGFLDLFVLNRDRIDGDNPRIEKP